MKDEEHILYMCMYIHVHACLYIVIIHIIQIYVMYSLNNCSLNFNVYYFLSKIAFQYYIYQ